MTKHAFIATLIAGSIALAIAARPLRAEPRHCAPRPDVLAQLAERYGESRRSVGLAADGVVVESFASETGSWTIFYTRPDGISCVLASGVNFETVDPPAPGAPA